jgi:ADP-heptose:LPS heptosyltransferase
LKHPGAQAGNELAAGWPDFVRSIVVTRLDGLGDLVLCTALLEGLHSRWPQAVIRLIVEPKHAAVRHILADWVAVEPLPFSSRDPIFGREAIVAEQIEQAAESFPSDLAVLAEFNGIWASELLVERMAPRDVICFNGPSGINFRHERIRANWKSNKSQPRRHVVSIDHENVGELQKYRAVCSYIGTTSGRPSLRLADADLDRARCVLQSFAKAGVDSVLCFPSTAEPFFRSPPVETWAAWIDDIRQTLGRQVVLVGSNLDSPVLNAIAAKVTDPIVVYRVGDDDFALLAGLLQLASAYIGADTGPMHMAAALGKPTLAVFGGGNGSRFLPHGRHTLVLRMPITCYECRWLCPFDSRWCLTEIPLEALKFASSQFFANVPDHPDDEPAVIEWSAPRHVADLPLRPIRDAHVNFLQLNHRIIDQDVRIVELLNENHQKSLLIDEQFSKYQRLTERVDRLEQQCSPTTSAQTDPGGLPRTSTTDKPIAQNEIGIGAEWSERRSIRLPWLSRLVHRGRKRGPRAHSARSLATPYLRIGFQTTLGINVGDEFIREGIRCILDQLKVPYAPLYVNKHDPTSLNTPCEDESVLCSDKYWDCDLFIQAGAPVYWHIPPHTSVNSGWHVWLWEERILNTRADRAQPVFVNLGAGACQAWGDDGAGFVADALCADFARRASARACLTTVRDPLAARILEQLGLPYTALPCPAFLAAGRHRLDGTGGPVIGLNWMPLGGHYDLSGDFDRVGWEKCCRSVTERLRALGRIVFVCHDEEEHSYARQFSLPVERVFYSRNWRDFFDVYSSCALVVANRVHGAVCAAGFGVPAIILGNDARAGIGEYIGLPVLRSGVAAPDEIVDRAIKLLSHRRAEKKRLINLRDDTLRRYVGLITPVVFDLLARNGTSRARHRLMGIGPGSLRNSIARRVRSVLRNFRPIAKMLRILDGRTARMHSANSRELVRGDESRCEPHAA